MNTDRDQCRCTNARHKDHLGKHCTAPATESDDYCKYCHDKAANEAMAAILPANIPIQFQVQLQDRFTLADSLSIEKVTEYYRRDGRATVLAVIIAGASTGVGLVLSGLLGAGIGFLISILAAILLPPIRTKIRQIERRP